MNFTHLSLVVFGATALALGPALAHAQDASRSVEGGGISVPGWMGRIDAREAGRGSTLEDSKMAMEGDLYHVTTGPSVVYWNPENAASGDYTVSATFHEAEYMSLNNHPHPYGIVIAGNDMGTEAQSYLYCAAYGSGRFIVRGFGPDAFALNGRRGEMHDAVNTAAGPGEPVTQEISVTVQGGTVACSINGTVVATYTHDEVVMEGRLHSTDGVYGIRFSHNTEATVSQLTLTGH